MSEYSKSSASKSTSRRQTVSNGDARGLAAGLPRASGGNSGAKSRSIASQSDISVKSSGDFPASNTGVKSPFQQFAFGSVLPVFHSGVDWLTLSATSPAGASQLEFLFADLVMALSGDGDLPKDGKWLQYRGTKMGLHLFYGQSKDGTVLRASSHVADDVMWRLRGLGELCFKATRVDTQLTLVYPDQPDRMLFRELADASYELAQTAPHGGRPWHVALRDEYGRGDTVYLGDRSSECYQRIYDKHHETRNKGAAGQFPVGAVRFEVEQKGSQAVKQLHKLLETDLVASYTAGYVRRAFETRGVAVPVDVASEAVVRSAPRSFDVERRLKWFRETVAPAVQQMIGAGYRDQVLEAMGLKNYV